MPLSVGGDCCLRCSCAVNGGSIPGNCADIISHTLEGDVALWIILDIKAHCAVIRIVTVNVSEDSVFVFKHGHRPCDKIAFACLFEIHSAINKRNVGVVSLPCGVIAGIRVNVNVPHLGGVTICPWFVSPMVSERSSVCDEGAHRQCIFTVFCGKKVGVVVWCVVCVGGRNGIADVGVKNSDGICRYNFCIGAHINSVAAAKGKAFEGVAFCLEPVTHIAEGYINAAVFDLGWFHRRGGIIRIFIINEALSGKCHSFTHFFFTFGVNSACFGNIGRWNIVNWNHRTGIGLSRLKLGEGCISAKEKGVVTKIIIWCKLSENNGKKSVFKAEKLCVWPLHKVKGCGIFFICPFVNDIRFTLIPDHTCDWKIFDAFHFKVVVGGHIVINICICFVPCAFFNISAVGNESVFNSGVRVDCLAWKPGGDSCAAKGYVNNAYGHVDSFSERVSKIICNGAHHIRVVVFTCEPLCTGDFSLRVSRNHTFWAFVFRDIGDI